MTYQTASLLGFLALASFAAHSGANQVPPKGTRPSQIIQIPKSTFPSRVSKASKLVKAKVLLKRLEPLVGLEEFVELSVQKPFVAEKAWLNFQFPYEMSVEENSISGLGDQEFPGPYGPGFGVNLTLQVARPQRVHMVSFYLGIPPGQSPRTFQIDGNPYSVDRGTGVLFYTFVPAKPGKRTFRLRPEPEGRGFSFSRVEVDVLN